MSYKFTYLIQWWSITRSNELGTKPTVIAVTNHEKTLRLTKLFNTNLIAAITQIIERLKKSRQLTTHQTDFAKAAAANRILSMEVRVLFSLQNKNINSIGT